MDPKHEWCVNPCLFPTPLDSHSTVGQSSELSGPVAITFKFVVEANGKAKAFWDRVRDGSVLSTDCFSNKQPNYTCLHVDDFGAAPVGQLEGHGGFKIWFVFPPTFGRRLVGQDEFQSGKPWFQAISYVATQALKNGWVFVQLPGNTVFIPPNGCQHISLIMWEMKKLVFKETPRVWFNKTTPKLAI